MWKNVVAIVVIGLVLGLIWPNYFKIKTSEDLAAKGHEKKHSVEIKELQDCNANNQKLKDEIDKLQDQKATTKEFTTCQKRLEDCSDLKGEINELRYQIQAATKESATCHTQLEDCNARSHISHEKSSDRLYDIICFVMFMVVLVLYFMGVCWLIRGNYQPRNYQPRYYLEN